MSKRTRGRARYWDCVWKDWRIEVKKGQILLDLVRYSEMFLKKTPESQQEVVTLFLFGKQSIVTDIYGVFTEALIHALRLTKEIATDLLRIRNQVVGRQLWALTKLHPRQIRRVASFHSEEI